MVVDTKYYEILQIQADADELTIKKVFVFLVRLGAHGSGVSTPSDPGTCDHFVKDTHLDCSTIQTKIHTLRARRKPKR
jgi:hypothetical protein